MKPFDRRIPAALTALVLAGQLCLPTAALSLSTAASPEGDVSITQAFPDRALQSWLMKQGNLGAWALTACSPSRSVSASPTWTCPA